MAQGVNEIERLLFAVIQSVLYTLPTPCLWLAWLSCCQRGFRVDGCGGGLLRRLKLFDSKGMCL